MTWQPIATAPRDGMPVLLYSPDSREPQVAIGFWLEDEDPAESGWYDYWNDSAPPIDADPTHWMPIPAAPVVAE
jgi:hypothetical protein